jgi:hypothetical protein
MFPMKLALSAISLLLIGACGVGDDGGLPGPTDPRLCTTEFNLTGSFTVGMAPPDNVNNDTQQPPGDGVPDIEGCWPTGMWTFTAAVTTNTPGETECAPAPTAPTQIQFKVDFVSDPVDPTYSYTVVAPTTFSKSLVKVSQGGGGLCEGQIEFFSSDGKETFNFHPVLNVFNQNGPLNGQGEFARFSVDQRPGF